MDTDSDSDDGDDAPVQGVSPKEVSIVLVFFLILLIVNTKKQRES